MDFNIAVIRGDGIGPEVVDQAILVLEKVGKVYSHRFKYEYLLAGGAAIDETGEPLPKATIKKCKNNAAVLLGAVGGPKWDAQPNDKRPEKAILGLREQLGLFANLRPAIVWDELAAACPLKDEIIAGGLDILIVRELTGGIYFGPKGSEVIAEASGISKLASHLSKEKPLPAGRFAYDVEQYSESEIERIAVTAFEMAMKRNKVVTSVDKSNVLESSRLWRTVVSEVHARYPEVKLENLYVDNAAMQLVRSPKQFDVIVTNNIFGDILSDEASQITGSIGMLPSASLGEKSFGLYEPIHGSAPDIAGQDKANPVAAILSAAMMLRYTFDRAEEADAIEKAVEGFLAKGYRTPDIHTEDKILVGTKDAGKLIADLIGA
ncbi:MAG: 3-isopropylmalate dehydrogenase [Clostridiales Family XIII bacterium]|jgi:3-isopropylmalate dehydrogenase|nr:3-isopropylmalate dehydrogenase [Clostridiales Family XIII bacterium]